MKKREWTKWWKEKWLWKEKPSGTSGMPNWPFSVFGTFEQKRLPCYEGVHFFHFLSFTRQRAKTSRGFLKWK